nr:MAG TPA: hypothetical protein [Caudoviricetes sp.]
MMKQIIIDNQVTPYYLLIKENVIILKLITI